MKANRAERCCSPSGGGAAAAILLATLLEAVAGTLLLFSVGENAAHLLTSVVAAPLIEESCKALALLGLYWFIRAEFDNVLDGLVYGALIGLGFAMTENVLYLGHEFLQGGARAVGELFVVRVVIDGFGHAVYTAIIGASLGWARERYARGSGRFIMPVIGWCLAVLLHMLWNGGVLVIGGLQGPDVSLIRVALLQAPLFTLLPLLVLWTIARIAGRRELQVLREQLAPEVARSVLTPGEYETLIDNRRRRDAVRAARAAGGRHRALLQRQFFHAAAELAFRKYHLSRGERPTPKQRGTDDDYRIMLAQVRGKLTGEH